MRRITSVGLWASTLTIGTTLFFSALYIWEHPQLASILSVLGASLIISSLVRIEETGALPRIKLLVALGESSYSIYLVHFSFISLVAFIIFKLNFTISEALVVGCALAGIIAGFGFDYAVDRPIQRWFRRKKSKIVPPDASRNYLPPVVSATPIRQ